MRLRDISRLRCFLHFHDDAAFHADARHFRPFSLITILLISSSIRFCRDFTFFLITRLRHYACDAAAIAIAAAFIRHRYAAMLDAPTLLFFR